MSQASAIKEIYDRKDNLFKLICIFNSSPGSYAHPGFIAKNLPEVVIRVINQKRRTRKQLNKALFRQQGIEAKQFYLDFSKPYLRLALLDGKTLHQLLVYAGIVYYYTNITKIVQKKTLVELQESIGEAAYHFALKKATLLTRLKPRLKNLSPNPKDLPKAMLTAGQRMLEYIFSAQPEALTRRLTLKFDPSWHWNFGHEIPEDEKKQIYTFLHKLLIKEINSDWNLCFT